VVRWVICILRLVLRLKFDMCRLMLCSILLRFLVFLRMVVWILLLVLMVLSICFIVIFVFFVIVIIRLLRNVLLFVLLLWFLLISWYVWECISILIDDIVLGGFCEVISMSVI